MPGSASSASSRHRVSGPKYRTKSKNSKVDDSLFGVSQTECKRQEMLQQKWNFNGIEEKISVEAAERKASRRSQSSSSAGSGIYGALMMPHHMHKDPSEESLIMSRTDFERIIRAARSLTSSDNEYCQRTTISNNLW